MSRVLRLFAIAVVVVVAASCNGTDTTDPIDGTAPPDAYNVSDQPAAAAQFASPVDGSTVVSPVLVSMTAEGVEVVPAGPPAAGEAHFHVVVNGECFEEGETIPGPSPEAQADGIHHFGDGSTERELELEPGEYTLCVQLADGAHTAFGQTHTIQITVE